MYAAHKVNAKLNNKTNKLYKNRDIKIIKEQNK